MSWLPPDWRVEAELEPGGRLVIWAKRGHGRPDYGERVGSGVGYPRRDADTMFFVPHAHLTACAMAWLRAAEAR